MARQLKTPSIKYTQSDVNFMRRLWIFYGFAVGVAIGFGIGVWL